MGKLLGAVLLVLVLAMVLAVVAFNLWGVWGLLGVIGMGVLSLFGLKLMVGVFLKKLFTAPFQMKGAVLRDAGLEVHSVTPAAPPAVPGAEAGEEEAEEAPAAEALAWYHLDVTVTPREPRGGFTHWEPGELVLAGPEAKGSEGLDDLQEDDACQVEEVRIWRDGQWQPDEEYKYPGPQRLRLLVGAPPDQRRARLRYYFEVFGWIELPAGGVLEAEPVGALPVGSPGS